MGELKHSFNNGLLKVVVSEESDAKEFAEIGRLAENRKDITCLSIDMCKCDCIQSKMLAELVALKKLSMKENFQIELLNISDSVAQILEMTNMQSVFSIRDDYSSYPLGILFDKFLDSVAAPDISNFLASRYDNDIREKLIELINEGDPIKTEYALLTMGRAQDFDSISIFRKELSSPFNNIKIAAILALGWLGDTESKDELYLYLVNKDTDVAEAASASIALLSDTTDAEKLDIYLDNENYKVRIMAARALTLINDEKCYEFIVRRLDREKNEQVRTALAKMLSFFNMEDVGGILVGLLDDASIAVRETAASGLVRIGVGKHAKTILGKVTDQDSWVGFFAAKSLVGLKDKEIAEGLEKAYPLVAPNVKLAIIYVLGKCGCVKDNFFLSKLKDANEDIRKEALNALSEMKSPNAVDAALSLYDKDSNWLVRYKAVEIILDLKPLYYEKILRKRLILEDNKYVKDKIIGIIGE